MPLPVDDNLLSINKASSLLGVSPDTLRRLDNKGRVVPIRGANSERLYSANDITLLKQVIKKPISERVYSIQEAANILKVSPQTIRRWEREGKIRPGRTPGDQRFFTLKDIQTIQNLPKKVQIPTPTQSQPITPVQTPTPLESKIPVIPIVSTPKPTEPEAVMPVASKPLIYEQDLPEYTSAPFVFNPIDEPNGNNIAPETSNMTTINIKQKRTNYVPYLVLFLLLLLLGGTVAFIGNRTFFNSNASNGIEASLPVASPIPTPIATNPVQQQIQQVATTVSGIFKAGSIIFQGNDGQLAEDNNNLFWDATNAFLGIGTNLPDAILSVTGKVGGATLVALKGQGTENILSAISSGQQVFNIDHAGNTQIAGSLSDINDSSLNVLQNLAVGGDVNVAGGDITSSNDLRVYSSKSTTLGISTLPTTIDGKDVTITSPNNIFFKSGALTNSIKLSNTATALPNGNTGIVDAIVDAYNHAGSVPNDEWSNASSVVYPNTTTDNLAVGGTTSSSPFYVAAATGDTKVGDLTVTGGNIQMTGVDCTGYTNGGVLTTDASGNVICGNDDGGAGGSSAFTDITSGTNTTAAMIVGTGASLNYSGIGTINASSFAGLSGTTGTTGQILTSGGGAAPTWQNITSNLTAGTDISITGTTNATINDTSTLNTVTGRGATTVNTITVGNLIDSGLTASKPVFTDANKQLTSTGTLGADQGGTGFGSYAVGDLLYADTTATLAKLADIATGNVLISGGIGAAPTYGKVTLGTHTTGNYVSTLTGTANQITASASTGDITLTIPSDFRAPGTVNATTGLYTGATAGTQRIDASGNLTNIGTTQLNGITYTWPAADAVSSGYVLSSNATGGLSWTPALTASSVFWAQDAALGVLYPKNSSVDVLIGSDSTSSAKFAFTGVNGGTPTASISGTYLTSTGNLATTNMKHLTIGGTTTGGVDFGSPITSGTWNGTAIGATYGGTGQTSYAVGDLLYADTTTTLAKLADIATGNVLISGGIGVAPSWDKVTLGTHTTGNYVSSLAGTANQITASAGTGDVTLTIPSDFRAPGTVNAVTGIYTGATAGTQRIDASGNLTNIGTTQLNNVIYTWPASIASNNYVLQTQTDGTLAWVDPAAAIASNIYWTSADGSLFPKNSSLDVLIGADSTSSAKFAFTGVGSGTPTASISGTYLTSTGNLANTNMEDITLGGATTGNVIAASPFIANSTITLPNGNTLTGVSNYLQLSNGISVGNGTTYYFDASGNINSNTLAVSGTTQLNGVTYTWPASIASNNYVLQAQTDGTLAWVDPAAAIASNIYWTSANGALFPKNNSTDVLIGSDSTSSAKFAFTGVASGTPTASISGATNIATFIDGNGNISSTNRNNLTLGNSATYNSTGNILLNPNGTGNVGIGTTSPTSPLQLSYSNTATSGTNYGLQIIPTYNQISGNAANTDLLVNRTQTAVGSGNQYLMDLQVGGATKLNVSNTGWVSAAAGVSGMSLQAWAWNNTAYTGSGTGAAYPGSQLIFGANSNTLDTEIAPLILRVSNTAGTAQNSYIGAVSNTGAGTYSPNIVFGQQTGSSAYTERMRIDQSGNLGIGTTSPTALLDVAGTASISGTLSFRTGTGTITATNMDHLVLGGTTTGQVDVNNNLNLATGNEYFINNTSVLNATTLGTGVVTSSLTTVGALASGSIASGFGTIETANIITGTVLNGTTGINTGATAGTQRIDASGNLTSIGTTQLNGITYTWPGAQTTNYVLQTDGSGTLSWADPNSAVASTIFWNQAAGALFPKNNTVDMLIGSDSTASAKFAFTGVGSGTPTASISGTYLTSAGNLANTNMEDVTLGGATTGNVIAASPFIANSTITLPNSNTLTGVTNYLQNSQGYSVGGGTTYYFDASGNIVANDIAAAGVGQFGGTTAAAYSRFGTATTDHGFTTAQDVLIDGNLELNGVLYLDGRTIANPNGTATVIFAADATAIDSPNILDNGTWLINNEVNNGMAALMVNNAKGGDIFSASASGTPKMTLTNAGNLGIGTTSPGVQTTAGRGYLTLSGSTGMGVLELITQAADADTNGVGLVQWTDKNSTATDKRTAFIMGILDGATANKRGGAISFGTRPNNVDVLTERMRITQGGNVGIGTTAPEATLDIVGADGIGDTVGALRISPTGAPTKLLKININSSGVAEFRSYTGGVGDSDGKIVLQPYGGNVGIGTTAPASPLSVGGVGAAGYGVYSTGYNVSIYGKSATGTGVYGLSNGAIGYGVYGYNNGATGYGVYCNSVSNVGGCAGNRAWTPASDARLKKDIVTIPNALDTVMHLRGVNFNWIEGSGADTGFIAQEVLPYVPQVVSQDATTGMYGVRTSQLTGLLVEAVKDQQGQIASLSTILANLSVTDMGDLDIAQDDSGNYQATNNGTIIDKIEAFAGLVAANITAGAIETQTLATNSFIAFQGSIDHLLITSGLVSANIQTALISPISGGTDITVKIGSDATPSGKFAIQNSEGTEVASIDSAGNSSFSGDATISGTLFADDIKSKSLEDIQALLTQVQTDQYTLFAATSSAELTASGSANIANLITNDMFVTGQASMNSVSIADSLTLGSDLVFGLGGNTINSLSTPLQIQSLALAPVEIMGGLVSIDTQGNVNIAGNLYVAGKIETKGLEIKDSSGAIVASIDASGSAQFADIQTKKITGSGEDRGSIEILPAEDTKGVERAWTSSPSAVLVTSSYKTQVWVTDISEKGFAVHVSDSPASSSGSIFWWALW